MTQTKTLARLFKSAASTSLALSALAGGVMLTGGEAKAITTVCVPPDGDLPLDPATANCTSTGDPVVSPFTNKASIVDSSKLPAGTEVNLEGTGLPYPISQQQIDTDFNPTPLTGGPVTSVYKIVTDASTPFNQVDLSWVDVPGAPGNVSARYVWATGEVTLNTKGAIAPVPLLTEITVYNTYTPGSGAIDNVQNTFRNVPGPLPILGAGAAFGFSRKLRGRIKGARTA